MKLFVALSVLALLSLPACANRAPTLSVAASEDAPQTTVYISSRVAEAVVERPVVVAESQPDPGPASAPSQPKAHHRAPKHAFSRSRQHAAVQTSHGSFHSITPD